MANRSTLTPDDVLKAIYLGEDADAFFNQCLFPLSDLQYQFLINQEGHGTIYESVKALLKDFGEPEDQEAYQTLLEEDFISIQAQKVEDYASNPYGKLLSSIGDYDHNHVHFSFYPVLPYAFFLLDDKKIVDGINDVSPLGYFTECYDTWILYKDGSPWMSLLPHEINTMKDPINRAHGRVATLGLGLGYYAYMVSMKDEVTSVDVFEKDPSIIQFFTETLLPKFPHKEKIHIHFKNAFNYPSYGPYDYVFADLWHNADDALPLYLRLLKIEPKDTEIDYWIETTILAYARRFIAPFLASEEEMEETFYDLEGVQKKIFGKFEKAFKGKSKEEIASLHDLRALRAFLYTL
ncbi:MAG: hypothetical protein ACI32C_01440 [Candidatus Enteromonas sp.]